MKFSFSSYGLALVLAVLPFSALAANSVLQQEQLEQARQNAALRESRLPFRSRILPAVHYGFMSK